MRGNPFGCFTLSTRAAWASRLIGGNKTGDDRWYETFVPLADKIYDDHLVTLKREGLLDG